MAILARLGPFCVAGFWIPALALAVLHKDPKASPPAVLAAGFLPDARDGEPTVDGVVGEVSEEKEDVLPPIPGLVPLPLRVEVGDNTEG